MEQILHVNVQTEQIHLVNVLTDQTLRAINVQTDQAHHVNVQMEQIRLVDVLIYVMLNFVLFVMLLLANV